MFEEEERKLSEIDQLRESARLICLDDVVNEEELEEELEVQAELESEAHLNNGARTSATGATPDKPVSIVPNIQMSSSNNTVDILAKQKDKGGEQNNQEDIAQNIDESADKEAEKEDRNVESNANEDKKQESADENRETKRNDKLEKSEETTSQKSISKEITRSLPTRQAPPPNRGNNQRGREMTRGRPLRPTSNLRERLPRVTPIKIEEDENINETKNDSPERNNTDTSEKIIKGDIIEESDLNSQSTPVPIEEHELISTSMPIEEQVLISTSMPIEEQELISTSMPIEEQELISTSMPIEEHEINQNIEEIKPHGTEENLIIEDAVEEQKEAHIVKEKLDSEEQQIIEEVLTTPVVRPPPMAPMPSGPQRGILSNRPVKRLPPKPVLPRFTEQIEEIPLEKETQNSKALPEVVEVSNPIQHLESEVQNDTLPQEQEANIETFEQKVVEAVQEIEAPSESQNYTAGLESEKIIEVEDKTEHVETEDIQNVLEVEQHNSSPIVNIPETQPIISKEEKVAADSESSTGITVQLKINSLIEDSKKVSEALVSAKSQIAALTELVTIRDNELELLKTKNIEFQQTIVERDNTIAKLNHNIDDVISEKIAIQNAYDILAQEIDSLRKTVENTQAIHIEDTEKLSPPLYVDFTNVDAILEDISGNLKKTVLKTDKFDIDSLLQTIGDIPAPISYQPKSSRLPVVDSSTFDILEQINVKLSKLNSFKIPQFGDISIKSSGVASQEIATIISNLKTSRPTKSRNLRIPKETKTLMKIEKVFESNGEEIESLTKEIQQIKRSKEDDNDYTFTKIGDIEEKEIQLDTIVEMKPVEIKPIQKAKDLVVEADVEVLAPPSLPHSRTLPPPMRKPVVAQLKPAPFKKSKRRLVTKRPPLVEEHIQEDKSHTNQEEEFVEIYHQQILEPCEPNELSNSNIENDIQQPLEQVEFSEPVHEEVALQVSVSDNIQNEEEQVESLEDNQKLVKDIEFGKKEENPSENNVEQEQEIYPEDSQIFGHEEHDVKTIISDEPIEVEEPTIEEPIEVEEPAIEEPIEVEEPTVEEPSIEDPIEIEEPTVEEPIEVEEPTIEEPIEVEELIVEDNTQQVREQILQDSLENNEILSEPFVGEDHTDSIIPEDIAVVEQNPFSDYQQKADDKSENLSLATGMTHLTNPNSTLRSPPKPKPLKKPFLKQKPILKQKKPNIIASGSKKKLIANKIGKLEDLHIEGEDLLVEADEQHDNSKINSKSVSGTEPSKPKNETNEDDDDSDDLDMDDGWGADLANDSDKQETSSEAGVWGMALKRKRKMQIKNISNINFGFDNTPGDESQTENMSITDDANTELTDFESKATTANRKSPLNPLGSVKRFELPVEDLGLPAETTKPKLKKPTASNIFKNVKKVPKKILPKNKGLPPQF